MAGSAVVREADVADGAALFLGLDPFHDAQALEFFPLDVVAHLVHQVVVHVVSPQALELLVEVLIEGGAALDEVLGEFRGDVDFVAHAVALQDLAQGYLVAWIDEGRVEVVDACVDRRHHFLFGLLQVDDAGRLGEPHTPVSEYRQFVAVFVFPVLHII